MLLATPVAHAEKKPPTPKATASNDVARQRHLVEIGIFGGVLVPPSDHEFYQQNRPPAARPLEPAAPEFGLRIAYLPRAWAGIELEGAFMPTSVDASGEGVMLYSVRGHLIAQLPRKVAPFFVIGGGLYAASSDDPVIGSDKDSAFHWGLGVKWYAHPNLLLRLDARHVVGPRLGIGGRTRHFEMLAGLSVILGYKADSDGDGVLDKNDKCPKQAGKRADGCPWGDSDSDGLTDDKDKCPKVAGEERFGGCPNPDRDGDGVANDKDRCPDQAGPAALSGCADGDKDGVADRDDRCPKVAGVKANGGCPADADKDGVADAEDRCPKVAGVKANNGCPPDKDGDGIPDAKDKCPSKPETKNGFQDDDGCPDKLPKKVRRFTGAIKGITFAFGKAKIRKRSFAVLDKAVKVLLAYKSLRLEIRGHTDNRGKRKVNIELSRKRAEAVRDYLQTKGVDAARLSAVGLGPDEPMANNKTRAGRSKNRRIEFKVLVK